MKKEKIKEYKKTMKKMNNKWTKKQNWTQHDKNESIKISTMIQGGGLS